MASQIGFAFRPHAFGTAPRLWAMGDSATTTVVLWLLLAAVLLFVTLEAVALLFEITLGPARPLVGLLLVAAVVYYLLK